MAQIVRFIPLNLVEARHRVLATLIRGRPCRAPREKPRRAVCAATRARELDLHEIGGPKQIVGVGARLEQFAGTVEADARVCQAVGDVGKEARARNYVDGLGPATATSLGVRRPEGDLLKGGDQSVDHQRPPRRH